MGKASKKITKKQKEKQVGEQQERVPKLKNQITELKAAEKYEDALKVVSELFQLKCFDIDVIFAAAELYFLDGDYERATVWVNKTMEFDASHIGARILLARICMQQDRTKDAINVVEFILRTMRQQLTEDQRTELEDIINYCKWTSEEDEPLTDYPNITEFLEIPSLQNVEEPQEVVESLIETAVDEAEEPAVETAVMEDTAESIQVDVMQETAAPQSAEAVKAEIMAKKASLQEKISLCNSFAGAYYYEGRLVDAETLLLASLALDEYNAETLRNLAWLALDRDDAAGALQYAARLPQTDFALIRAIKEQD